MEGRKERNKITIEVDDLSKVSDGFHTLKEIYDHRCLLWILFCVTGSEKTGFYNHFFFVKDHFEGWDLISCRLPVGQISYHVPVLLRHLYDTQLIEKTKEEAELIYDGHTSQDVLDRIMKYLMEI